MRTTAFSSIVLPLLLATFISCGQGNGGAQNGALVHLGPAEFSQAIQKNEVVLIDVRTPEEYQGGYIQGANNLNYFVLILRNPFRHLQKRNRYTCTVHLAEGVRQPVKTW